MDTEDDAKYPLIPYGMNQGYGSSSRPKGHSSRNCSAFTHNGSSRYVEENNVENDDEEDLDDEEEEDEHEGNGVQRLGNNEDEDDDGEEEDDDEYGDTQRHPKKRKLKSLLSSYEFAPRVPATPAPPPPAAPKTTFGGRSSVADWSEHETFILLDAWGEKFLQHGRKSLRSEEWQEVAEKVSQKSKIDRTDGQCRNRLDTLKKKYKKEKTKISGSANLISKWIYFNKMDSLMSSPPQQAGLSCGFDSGEYVFMNPGDYLNRSNGQDEMRDSPENSESAEGEEDSDGLPASFNLLADSIQKFSDMYEKIENGKRKQMLELEKMRMDFHRDLELQKRQIMERAQAEIAKIHQGDDDDNETISG